MGRQYVIEVTMPNGEKLEPIKVDRDAFILTSSYEVGIKIASLVTALIDQRLKA